MVEHVNVENPCSSDQSLLKKHGSLFKLKEKYFMTF